MPIRRRSTIICAVALIASTVCPQVFSQRTSGASKLSGDEQAIHDYVLTMDRVQRYMDVATKLIAATRNDAALDVEVKKIAGADASNLEKVAIADRSPHIALFLKNNDTTPRDFVMTPLTLFSAMEAVVAKGKKSKASPFVNAVNIKFVLDHGAELEKYKQSTPRTTRKST